MYLPVANSSRSSSAGKHLSLTPNGNVRYQLKTPTALAPSGNYLPKFMKFLYGKNRLSVALSRARFLVLLVASPELMTIKRNRLNT
jgi:hypothetical protein